MNKNKEFILQLLTEKEYRYLEILNHPHFANNPLLAKTLVNELHLDKMLRPTLPGPFIPADNPRLKISSKGRNMLAEYNALKNNPKKSQNKTSTANTEDEEAKRKRSFTTSDKVLIAIGIITVLVAILAWLFPI